MANTVVRYERNVDLRKARMPTLAPPPGGDNIATEVGICERSLHTPMPQRHCCKSGTLHTVLEVSIFKVAADAKALTSSLLESASGAPFALHEAKMWKD